jgi:hypothetical protein
MEPFNRQTLTDFNQAHGRVHPVKSAMLSKLLYRKATGILTLLSPMGMRKRSV